jgi:type II secretory pathway predicted ATPase ExeA
VASTTTRTTRPKTSSCRSSGLSVKALVTDALDQVATQRRGVVVLGPKGCGKSLALRHALGEFAALERARERRRPRYRRRRVLQVRGIRADRYVDAAVVLLREVSGTSPQVRVHGRLKKHDELLLELVLQLLEQRYAAVVVDEAELLSD